MKVHFLGIGGSGASAVASIAKAQGLPAGRQGFEVTGCDLEPNNEFTSEFTDSELLKGHDPKHLEGIDILAITPAINSLDPDNPELKAAKEKNIPIMTWQEFLGKYLEKDKFVIAICGTHGKSTITAMIGQLLEDAGLDPTVVLGAIIPKWGRNYRIPTHHVILGSEATPESKTGKDSGQARMTKEIFVVEADEFNDNFLHYNPDITVVSNIEMDHPEFFKDFDAVLDSFEKFLGQTKKLIIANLSDEWVAEVLKQVMKRSKVASLDYSKTTLNLPLKIPGKFNEQNSAAAFLVGMELGIDPQLIRKSLSEFSGAARRFEYLGEYRGTKIYSDFGHHPTEIKTTVEVLREKFPAEYIWLIFQPHMFSRTRGLFKEFVSVFQSLSKKINQTLILDIYPSREVDTGLVSSEELVMAIDEATVDFVAREELKKILSEEPRQGDIIFFMGAGDIDKIARELPFADQPVDLLQKIN